MEKAYFAEGIGAFALVFIGAGAVLMSQINGMGILGVALAHGIVLMAMIYATGHISGGHINPAITVSMMLTKQIDMMRGVGYIVSQLIGASIGGFLLLLTIGTINAPVFVDSMHLGATDLAAGIGMLRGIAIEAVLTFFLAFTVFGVAVDKRAPAGLYGLAIGLVLVFDILVGGALTGASMNPARSFGPAIASMHFANHLVYWIGPIIGAAVAGLLYKGVFLEKAKKKQ